MSLVGPFGHVIEPICPPGKSALLVFVERVSTPSTLLVIRDVAGPTICMDNPWYLRHPSPSSAKGYLISSVRGAHITPGYLKIDCSCL